MKCTENVFITKNRTKIVISSDQFDVKDITLFSEELELLRFSIPISLDYKLGVEALSDKYLKSMFAFGVGIAPQFVSYSFLGGYVSPSLSPFLKAEVGYYLGVAFKIRVLYFISDQYWDQGSFQTNFTSNSIEAASYRLSSGGDIRVALIVMPYSGSWE